MVSDLLISSSSRFAPAARRGLRTLTEAEHRPDFDLLRGDGLGPCRQTWTKTVGHLRQVFVEQDAGIDTDLDCAALEA